MPTACTLDPLEITAARPGDPKNNYFATRRLYSRCGESKIAVFDEVKDKLSHGQTEEVIGSEATNIAEESSLEVVFRKCRIPSGASEEVDAEQISEEGLIT